MASLLAIFGALVALAILRFFARGVYRMYFHPLSKFPGPKLYSATRIPNHIALIKGNSEKVYLDLHRKYGPVVRVGPDELSYTDGKAWKDIYGHGTKGTVGSTPHKDLERMPTTPNKAISLFIAPDGEHGRQRKIFTPAFSDRALKQQEPLFLKYINQLVSILQQSVQEDPETKFDMVRMYNFTTFDVMGDLTFGEPLHMLDNAEYDPWVRIIFASIKAGTFVRVLSCYSWARRLFDKFLPASMDKKRLDHFNHSATRVAKRMEKGRDTEGVDLWDLVINQKDGRGLTRPQMEVNASLFMIAGTETTATLLAGLTYLLTGNPECSKKLSQEIRGEFESAADMTMERLAALPYLNACIKEALRIYPPVPVTMARRTPPDGSTILGEFVPPGTIVGIAQHVMNMSERNFKRPTEFLPQRWLGDPEFDTDDKQALQPFSYGSRDCVGKNMAYHEMRLIAANVYFNFDIELCPESENWIEQPTYMLWEKRPLMCKLRPVK